ncbi:hypothetical protein SELMODRAFT_441670 [Selaginella moellendorffii]|uniref:FAF domain-containing protein n=1 Tax=Selaginella moellendorffii TaxID=88036 RepID=D8RLV1_SELML|nr:hypothetical protein SELMODRAFT_441670 [Selaginella moellendorffii]
MRGPVMVDSMIQLPQMEKSSAEDDQHPHRFRKGEFPPPMPSLARTSYNHLPLQVPWTLLSANRSNNRVVLHEIKAAHGAQLMLFQPIRSQGRLVLQMLRHDSDDELGGETDQELEETETEEEPSPPLESSSSGDSSATATFLSTTASTGSTIDMESELD